MSVRIAAVADIHSPRYLPEFQNVLSRCERPDLFLLAGDIVNRGVLQEYPKVLDLIHTRFGSDLPIVACLGNEDPIYNIDDLLSVTEDRVTIVDDQVYSFSHSQSTIAIVGISPVVAGHATVNDFQVLFEERSKKISGLLHEAARSADTLILLMHFSPLSENNLLEFSWWISQAVEESPPNLIIHGHVHDSIQNKMKIGTTTIRNVALPATSSITELVL